MTKLSPFAAKKNKRDKNRVTIGKVGAPHGIHGEMRIIPLTDFVERFETMKEVMVGSEMLHIESCTAVRLLLCRKVNITPLTLSA